MRRIMACVMAILLALGLSRAGLCAETLLNLVPASNEIIDRKVRVYNDQKGAVVEMGMESYIMGVLAAEMPVEYELEALKAQAVAARTYTARKLAEYGGSGCRSHAGADICTDSGCCQAYVSRAALEARWGDEAEEKIDRIELAVNSTRGELVTYKGEPIEAMYHASSGGHTEDVEQVYAQALPYLRGVVSEGEQDAPQYSAEQTFTRAELQRALSVTLDGALRDEITILERSEADRVTRVRVGGEELTGTQFRRRLGLRSSNFTLQFSGDSVIFHTLGYGHGVGMSQTGANAMARRGIGYREILTWYYTGTAVG